jgi:hypothetical protein
METNDWKWFNVVAKRIREGFPTQFEQREARSAMTNMALAFAKYFNDRKDDYPTFDPITFLERCSPDPILYPIEELWKEDGEA